MRPAIGVRFEIPFFARHYPDLIPFHRVEYAAAPSKPNSKLSGDRTRTRNSILFSAYSSISDSNTHTYEYFDPRARLAPSHRHLSSFYDDDTRKYYLS